MLRVCKLRCMKMDNTSWYFFTKNASLQNIWPLPLFFVIIHPCEKPAITSPQIFQLIYNFLSIYSLRPSYFFYEVASNNNEATFLCLIIFKTHNLTEKMGSSLLVTAHIHLLWKNIAILWNKFYVDLDYT